MNHVKIIELTKLYSSFTDKVKRNELSLFENIYVPMKLDICSFILDTTFEEKLASGFCLSTLICNPNYKLNYDCDDLLNIGFSLKNIRFIENLIFYCGLPKPSGCSLRDFLTTINPDYLNIKILKDNGFSCRDLKKLNDCYSPWILGLELFSMNDIIDNYSLFELDINIDKKILVTYLSYQDKAENHLRLSELFLGIFNKRRISKNEHSKILSAVIRRTLFNNSVSNSRLFLGNILKRKVIFQIKNNFYLLKENCIILQSFIKRYVKRKTICDICKCNIFSFYRFRCCNNCNYCYDCYKNLIKSELSNISIGLKSFYICCGLCHSILEIEEVIYSSRSIGKMVLKTWWKMGESIGHESFNRRYIELKDIFDYFLLNPSWVSFMVNFDVESEFFHPDYDIMYDYILRIGRESIVDFFIYLRDLSYGRGEREEHLILSKKYKKIQEGDATSFFIDDIQSRILNPRCPKCKTIIFWFDGCFAIECSCGNHICGWCLDFYGNNQETHEHVLGCELSKRKGELYGRFEEFEWVHIIKSFYRFHYYLMNIDSKKLRHKIRKKIVDMNVLMDPVVFYQMCLFS